MASRAVQLEMAYSLDTSSCINALCRFISRRGQISHIRSDNRTNFVGAERELREALSALNHQKILNSLLQFGVKWSFNTPAASHHDRAWERIIHMVKKVLNSVLHQQSVDDEGLQTLLCKVEAILNDRPITKSSDDPNDLEPLTPNQLLLLKGKPAPPPGLFDESAPKDDGGKFNFSQTFSGTDGCGSTYHCYRNDNGSQRTRQALLQKTLSL